MFGSVRSNELALELVWTGMIIISEPLSRIIHNNGVPMFAIEERGFGVKPYEHLKSQVICR